MKLTGNTFLITGGGTGIGLAWSKLLLEKGNKVIICGRRQEKLDEACAKLPGLKGYVGDVGQPEDQKRLFDAIQAGGDCVNVLVNNAAAFEFYDLSDPESLDIEKIRRDVQTNLLGPIELVNLFLPTLRKQEGATIINLNSPACTIPVTMVPIYSATKAGLHSYTCSLRAHLEGEVEVIEVIPPMVESEMTSRVIFNMITAEEFAERLMKRLAKGGDELWIGDGVIAKYLARIAPRATFKLINGERGAQRAPDA